MKLALLYARMLRYRVAVMLWMFLLLAAAYGDGLHEASFEFVWATLALASSYVAATSVNDVADRDIARVNHPCDAGRPLVTGDATERDLTLLHVVAIALALAAAVPLGGVAVGVVACSLTIGRAYSVRPLLLSHRTWLAPLALAVAYVLVPYVLGLVAADARATRADALFASALFALFVARIVLKDFRDREGDTRYGKPTLLLRFGKTSTCVVSAGALFVGNALLLAAVAPPPLIAIVLELFVAAIAWMLYSLWRATDERAEQLAIGIGAKAGNGLLIATLGWLIVVDRGASHAEQLGVVASVAGAFALSFFTLIARPDEAVIAYKG